MKKISIRIIGVFVVAALIFSGCKKWIDTDININPDAPSDAPMSTILSAVEANMGYNTIGGNDICRITGLWMQYLQGIARQSQSTADYNLREGDINNQWNNTYAESMMNLKQIMDKATGTHPHYLGVAQILMANSLGITSDMWNEIPYNEAFQGAANLTPAFQSQQEIYATIQQLLDDAILNLQIVGNYEDVGGDYIYNGNLELWIKAAYALKARYTLHLSKINPTTAYADVLALLPNGFTSNADDMIQPFGTIDADGNPFYQFMNERGDVSMHSFFVNMLLQRLDPRITVYATEVGGTYIGNGPGGTDPEVSMPGTAVASVNSPVPFISYTECLFMKAECEFMTGVDWVTVKQTIVDGLTASLQFRGVYSEEYILGYKANFLDTISVPALLFNEIMTQKYIALYYQAEPFNDWRRTGLPYLTPNVQGLEVPRRFPYPTEEITYNPNTPTYGNIWNRVWWDALLQ